MAIHLLASAGTRRDGGSAFSFDAILLMHVPPAAYGGGRRRQEVDCTRVVVGDAPPRPGGRRYDAVQHTQLNGYIFGGCFWASKDSRPGP